LLPLLLISTRSSGRRSARRFVIILVLACRRALGHPPSCPCHLADPKGHLLQGLFMIGTASPTPRSAGCGPCDAGVESSLSTARLLLGVGRGLGHGSTKGSAQIGWHSKRVGSVITQQSIHSTLRSGLVSEENPAREKRVVAAQVLDLASVHREVCRLKGRCSSPRETSLAPEISTDLRLRFVAIVPGSPERRRRA